MCVTYCYSQEWLRSNVWTDVGVPVYGDEGLN